jgi:hypothetical protein
VYRVPKVGGGVFLVDLVKIQSDLDCLDFKAPLTQFTMMITVLMDIHVSHGVVQHMMSLMAIGKRPGHLVS